MPSVSKKPSDFQLLALTGQKVLLKAFSRDLVNERYLSWIHDQETTEFIWKASPDYTLGDLRQFAEDMMSSPNDLFFSIHCRASDLHIGNLRLGPVDWSTRFSGFGIMVGDPAYRGSGFGGEATRLATDYALTDLRLNGVRFEVVADNLGAVRMYERLGFLNRGATNKKFQKNGKAYGLLEFERTKD